MNELTTPENWVYPTSYEQYVLKAKLDDNGETIAHLTNVFTKKTEMISVTFTENMCKHEGETVIICDKLVAKDGGKPYLFLTSVEKVGERDFAHVRKGIKFELARSLLYDEEFVKRDENKDTYRMRIPPLFHVSEIDKVYDFILPNFYAETNGLHFFSDIPWLEFIVDPLNKK
jgi:hypothetical protein